MVACWCSVVAIPAVVFSQNSFVPSGGEYSIVGGLPGDQVHPCVSFTTNGGFITWQDNWIDGNGGLGIGAMRLENDLTGSEVPFRVNSLLAGDHENAQVSMLNNGGAVFAWQGGKQGFQHIYARFLSPSNNWVTGDVLVNSATNSFQSSPVIATLLNGNVVVVYGSMNQAGPNSMMDVYFQMFTPQGAQIGSEFLVNQFTSNNQRSPAVVALANGSFAISWVSEQERWTDANNGVPSVDIYARVFNSDGTPSAVNSGTEFLVNVSSNICAYPSLAAAPDGGFMATWMERDLVVRANGWDIYARRFSGLGVGGNVTRVNTQLYGDQSIPKIQSAGTNYFDIWNSMGQDGSKEGVFGSFLNDDASTSGNELQVNTTTRGSQMHQTLGSDGVGRFFAAWTSLGGRGVEGFDLFGQRYANPALVSIGTNNNIFNNDPNANPSSVSNTPPPISVTLSNLPGPTISTTDITKTFNDVKGVYNGLVIDQQNGTGVANSGYVTITTTAKGSFSAKLQLGGKSYSFSGQFSPSGTNSTKLGQWTISLALDLHGGNVITGQIATGNSVLSLQANLNVFSKANPTPLAGAYTMVVQMVVPPLSGPTGSGVGTLNVSASGNVQYKLTLPDGTSVSGKTTLSGAGAWPLYAAAYKNSGVAIGWVQFSGAATNGFDGQCAWTKPAGAGAPYNDGVTNAITVQGSAYQAPKAAAIGNWQIVFSGGDLSSSITNSVKWGLNNKVANGGPNPLSLSFTPATGLFKGTVVDPVTGHSVPFQGVLLEKSNVGLGFFPGSNQSGGVTLAPNP